MLSLVFISCWFALAIGETEHTNLLIAISGASAVLNFFVRCESCKTSIYYRAGGERNFTVGPYYYRFMLAAKCPVCGLRRL